MEENSRENSIPWGLSHLGGNRPPQAVMNDNCYHLIEDSMLPGIVLSALHEEPI